jgi:hypothetical protein
MSGKVSAGFQVVSAGFANRVSSRCISRNQPMQGNGNIRAVRGIFIFSSQVPDVPELIFITHAINPQKFDSGTFG